MSDSFSAIAPLLLWAPAFLVVISTNAVVALANRPLGRSRWPLAAWVLTAPLWLPSADIPAPSAWGSLDTVVTTMAIISAARLPALDHALLTRSRRGRELFFWMTVPMARFWPDAAEARRRNRRLAPRFLLSAALKRLAWEPFALFVASSGDAVPWLLKSALLMLFFLLNVTAAADLLSALCLALGCDVDELFHAPLLSRSPRDFWSSRWNRFISRFALKHVALPLRRKWGKAGVVLGVFVTSGAFHEYFAWGVSQGSARHGYMTLFFLIQGIAVYVGGRLRLPALPHALGTALTFGWMMLTSPLFFAAVEPALAAFAYPSSWYPFHWLVP